MKRLRFLNHEASDLHAKVQLYVFIKCIYKNELEAFFNLVNI